MASSSSWDPETIFQITNQTKGHATCVGEARTQGRRCWRRVAQSAVSYARGITYELASLGPLKAAAESPKLEQMARLMLCYQHPNQVTEVVSEWKSALRGCADKPHFSETQQPQPSHVDLKDLLAQMYTMQEELREMRAQQSTWKPFAGFAEGGPSGDDQRPMKSEHKIWLPLSELANADWRQFEAEDQRRKAEAAERRRKRREQEERRREEEERERRRREEEELKRAREQQERERIKREVKERADYARERARKKATEREATARKEWAEAWERYGTSWAAIESGRSRNADIPWPTKSGMQRDVTEASVRQFFDYALPRHLFEEPGEEVFRSMTHENKRWHTDKILSRFGNDILAGSSGKDINMISKLMVKLWKEAKLNREHGR